MVFKRKESFFLDLGSQDAKPAKVAIAKVEPVQEEAPKGAKQAPAQAQAKPAAAAPAAAPEAAAPQAPGSSLTTAEAIAAELRAAQEARPAPTLSTFAPDALNPGNAMAMRRRQAGANLAGFKAMAKSMTGK
jgi:hypothetical protein